jgi:hypothetical protein
LSPLEDRTSSQISCSFVAARASLIGSIHR